MRVAARDFPVLPSDHRRAGYVDKATISTRVRGFGHGQRLDKLSPPSLRIPDAYFM